MVSSKRRPNAPRASSPLGARPNTTEVTDGSSVQDPTGLVSAGGNDLAVGETQAYLEELSKPFRIKRKQSIQILIRRRLIHAHPPQLHISQPSHVGLACFGVDGLLQPRRFTEDLPPLRIFRVECGVARKCPT